MIKKYTMWCPAHRATLEQLAELAEWPGGELFLLSEQAPELFARLTDCPSDVKSLHNMAEELIEVARRLRCKYVVLPIGSPAFNFVLAPKLERRRFHVGFAHSRRESQDVPQPDGTVKKVSLFRHEKFIWL
jgi:hypothetical protein